MKTDIERQPRHQPQQSLCPNGHLAREATRMANLPKSTKIHPNRTQIPAQISLTRSLPPLRVRSTGGLRDCNERSAQAAGSPIEEEFGDGALVPKRDFSWSRSYAKVVRGTLPLVVQELSNTPPMAPSSDKLPLAVQELSSAPSTASSSDAKLMTPKFQVRTTGPSRSYVEVAKSACRPMDPKSHLHVATSSAFSPVFCQSRKCHVSSADSSHSSDSSLCRRGTAARQAVLHILFEGWQQVRPRCRRHNGGPWSKFRASGHVAECSASIDRRATFLSKMQGNCFNCLASDHKVSCCKYLTPCWLCHHSGHISYGCQSRRWQPTSSCFKPVVKPDSSIELRLSVFQRLQWKGHKGQLGDCPPRSRYGDESWRSWQQICDHQLSLEHHVDHRVCSVDDPMIWEATLLCSNGANPEPKGSVPISEVAVGILQPDQQFFKELETGFDNQNNIEKRLNLQFSDLYGFPKDARSQATLQTSPVKIIDGFQTPLKIRSTAEQLIGHQLIKILRSFKHNGVPPLSPSTLQIVSSKKEAVVVSMKDNSVATKD